MHARGSCGGHSAARAGGLYDWPRRRVVSRARERGDIVVDTLECGHTAAGLWQGRRVRLCMLCPMVWTPLPSGAR